MWSPEQGQPSFGEWVLHGCPGVSGDEDMEIWGDGNGAMVDGGEDKARLQIQFNL